MRQEYSTSWLGGLDLSMKGLEFMKWSYLTVLRVGGLCRWCCKVAGCSETLPRFEKERYPLIMIIVYWGSYRVP